MIGRMIGVMIIFFAGCLAGDGSTVSLFGFWWLEYLITLVLVLLGYHLIVSDSSKQKELVANQFPR